MLSSRILPAAVGVCLLFAVLPAQVSTGPDPVTFRHPDGTVHVFQAFEVPAGITWAAANAAAAARGGVLATVGSLEENNAVLQSALSSALWTTVLGRVQGPWLGGLQDPTPQEPAGGWRWAEGDPFTFTHWSSGFPDDQRGANRIHLGGVAMDGRWADAPAADTRLGYIVEFAGPHVPLTVGLIRDDPGASPGYTLISPWQTTQTHLLDLRGRVVRSWVSKYTVGMSSYMIGKGEMLRCGSTGNPRFSRIGGNGGIVEVFDWSGQVRWSFVHSTDQHCLHHDVARLPNGNILMIAWEFRSTAEAIAAGRNPAWLTEGELWPETIVEVKPVGTGGKIVWKWSLWDHLIQDFDATKANFGRVAGHPERVDINFPVGRGVADWVHANSIDYNPTLDQIVISARELNEIWVIDHSTTTKEAAGHTGGRSGKGGDLLYRWGNPEAYRAGTAADRQLFLQHDATWIGRGLPGAGNMLIFSNGTGRPGGNASSVEEITTPVDRRGRYRRSGGAFGPVAPTWTYRGKPDFYSAFVSGAQRMKNGNTLVGAGWSGHIYEVDPGSQVVWEYETPVTATGVANQGDAMAMNVFFRAPRYTAKEIGVKRRDLVAGPPLEFHDSVLLIEGSTLPHRAKAGASVALDLRARDDRGKVYLVGTSVTPGLLPLEHRFVRMGADPILSASLSGSLGSVFEGYLGVLDSAGAARATLHLPRNPALAGTRFYTTFVVADPLAVGGFALISNTVVLDVE